MIDAGLSCRQLGHTERYANGRCAECNRAYQRRPAMRAYQIEYQKQPRVKQRHREYHMVRTYGLTPEQVEEIRSDQGNRCAICRNPFDKPQDAHIDHCHKTREIRGLLCGPCNRGVGMFCDDPTRLRAAALYMERSRD